MKSQIANRKSQISKSIINQFYFRFIFCCAIIILLFPAKIFAQGNLNISLVPKTYVGNYHTSCYGSNNGEIEILISGGTAPYSVLWNNSSTANPLLNIGAGTYAVIVTDVNNASVADTITLIQPPALGYSLEVSQFGEYNLAYYGSTLGHIKINGTGGTPAYSVVWNDSNTELIRDSMSAGSYTFVLSDANGCTMNGTKTLTQPSILSSSTNLIHGVSCFGGEDGAAQVTPSGGIAPYSYLWDNGNFTATPNDLSSGWHLVHITDVADNHHADSILVTQASEISANISKSTYPNSFNVSCYNCFNGTLDATVSGGTAPYTYEWIWQDNNIGTTANLSNLGGGNYELIVSDQNNCRLRTETELKEPERQDWSMTGNAGTDPSTQFIGTTDSVDVVFKTNGSEQLRLSNNYTKISSGKILIGDSLGIFSRTETNGTKVLLFGERHDDLLAGPNGGPLGIHYCAQTTTTANLFDGFIYSRAGWNAGSQPQLSLGADGNNGLIEATDGDPVTSNYEPKLLLNYYCGNDVVAGNAQQGRLIANYKLGVKTANPESELHVVGNTILDGNVRIGNANSTAANYSKKLVVEGIVFSREFKVTDDQGVWPDFVFAKGHKRKSIPELKSFIDSTHHLPDIPSAEEIKEQGGYSLNEIVRLLLQKQEESSLYIIELFEQQQLLAKENEHLKAQLKALEQK